MLEASPDKFSSQPVESRSLATGDHAITLASVQAYEIGAKGDLGNKQAVNWATESKKMSEANLVGKLELLNNADPAKHPPQKNDAEAAAGSPDQTNPSATSGSYFLRHKLGDIYSKGAKEHDRAGHEHKGHKGELGRHHEKPNEFPGQPQAAHQPEPRKQTRP